MTRGRLGSNPVALIPKLDEARDRRKIRRPLTDDELSRLMAVGEQRGRKLWYLLAARQGLRRGDLVRLTWADVDFEHNTLTIRDGKARRTDVLTMHSQVAEELKKRQNQTLATPQTRIFPKAVANDTRVRDFERARIPLVDEQGRVADLHALRTTLGTQLARQGVAPQLAQKILRHADYRTTLNHYTVLGLADTNAALNQLPSIASGPQRQSESATGTCDEPPAISTAIERRTAAKACEPLRNKNERRTDCDSHKALHSAKISNDLQGNARGCEDSGRRESNPHGQLGRLELYH